jgi:hypothetical protein
VFDWFKNKAKRNVPDHKEFSDEPARPVAYQGKIQTALAAVGVTLADNLDKDQFCIDASTAIARKIADLANVDSRRLTGRDQFAFGIVAATVCDVVGKLIESKSDKMFPEADCSATLISLFGEEYAKEIGQLWGKYNELSQTGPTIRELRNQVKAWIIEPHPERLKAIARGYSLTRLNYRGAARLSPFG